jgi:hypothetical protein
MANSQEIVIPKNFGHVSKVFGNVQATNELAAGIQASFAVVKYRGKVWSVNYRGEENTVMRADGDGQANSIEVVIVKASPVLQKTYYLEGWQPGSTASPDCFSNDGLKPEASSPHLQNDYCKTCKHNQFGTGPNGRGKACADSKRLVVVPVDDMRNEAYGGPMLLRVPAASLQNMAAFGDKLKQLNYPVYGVATRVSFDPKVTHPQFVFGAIRALGDDEAEVVQELRNDERVDRILSLAHEDAQQSPEALKPEDVFEQPPEPKPNIKPNTELKKELKKEACKTLLSQISYRPYIHRPERLWVNTYQWPKRWRKRWRILLPVKAMRQMAVGKEAREMTKEIRKARKLRPSMTT